MKRQKAELARVMNLLENDRINVSDGFSEVLFNDMVKLFSDYFEVLDTPQMIFKKSNEGYEVDIKFNTSKIKYFNIVPK